MSCALPSPVRSEIASTSYRQTRSPGKSVKTGISSYLACHAIKYGDEVPKMPGGEGWGEHLPLLPVGVACRTTKIR